MSFGYLVKSSEHCHLQERSSLCWDGVVQLFRSLVGDSLYVTTERLVRNVLLNQFENVFLTGETLVVKSACFHKLIDLLVLVVLILLFLLGFDELFLNFD